MTKTITKTTVSDRAVQFVLSRNLEDLGVLTEDMIAKAIGVSLPYLLREFRSTQKITLKDFITREKIHTAIFMLEKEHEIPIEKLAGELGFSRINQFIEIFRNYIAIDPMTYKYLKYHRKLLLNIDH